MSTLASCDYCLETFDAERASARFCSGAHRTAANRRERARARGARDARIRSLVALHSATVREGMTLLDMDAVRPELDRIAGELDALLASQR